MHRGALAGTAGNTGRATHTRGVGSSSLPAATIRLARPCRARSWPAATRFWRVEGHTGEGRRAAPFLFAMSDLHEKVRRTIRKFDLLSAGDGAVIAVCGGVAPVGLLALLR